MFSVAERLPACLACLLQADAQSNDLARREAALKDAQQRLDRQAEQSQDIMGKMADQQGNLKMRERQMEEQLRWLAGAGEWGERVVVECTTFVPFYLGLSTCGNRSVDKQDGDVQPVVCLAVGKLIGVGSKQQGFASLGHQRGPL